MSLLIVSNRLPVNIHRKKGTYEYSSSPGSLPSGMRSYVEKIKNQNDSEMEISWVGWPGASVKQADQERVKKEMAKNFGIQCIFLSEELIEKFYHGFCNKTLWPLFHYFPLYAEYENEFWQGYQIVNEQFCNKVLEIYKPGDTIWVHDYHLMLLPGMIRCKIPDAIIGFFLHIRFPSYEKFKLLPRSWSEALLSGIYGSSLIAFHTHNYRTSSYCAPFAYLVLKTLWAQ